MIAIVAVLAATRRSVLPARIEDGGRPTRSPLLVCARGLVGVVEPFVNRHRRTNPSRASPDGGHLVARFERARGPPGEKPYDRATSFVRGCPSPAARRIRGRSRAGRTVRLGRAGSKNGQASLPRAETLLRAESGLWFSGQRRCDPHGEHRRPSRERHRHGRRPTRRPMRGRPRSALALRRHGLHTEDINPTEVPPVSSSGVSNLRVRSTAA